MHYCKKFGMLSVLTFIFICLPIAFIFIFLRHIPIIFSLIEDYVNSGSSFFIPFIPNINLLGFLPERGPTIGLTLGQLIDIIIMINLFAYIESSIYHFFKKKYLNEELQEIKVRIMESNTNQVYVFFNNNHAMLENAKRMYDLLK